MTSLALNLSDGLGITGADAEGTTMDTIQISTLATLAGKWQHQADSEMVTASEETRAAVRACADTLRMLCEVRFEDCPHAAPHRYCAQCPVSPCPIGLGQRP